MEWNKDNSVLTEAFHIKGHARGVSDIEVILPIRPHYVIAGGYFTSIMHKEAPKDIDIFIIDPPRDLDSWLISRYGLNNNISSYKKQSSAYIKNDMIKHVYDFGHKIESVPVQIIVTKYKTREELISHFDYAHCCVSYYPETDKLYMSEKTYKAIIEKRLVVNNPTSVVEWRKNKFLKRGFKE